MKLEHDVLKRTAGLLHEIDRVLAAPTVAERVDRVLQSAAPAIGNTIYPSFEDWDKWYRIDNGLYRNHEELDDLSRYACQPNRCGCERIVVHFEATNPDTGHSWESAPAYRECELDHLGRAFHHGDHIDPFREVGIDICLSYAGGRAANTPCGHEGCACRDVIVEPTECEHCGDSITHRRPCSLEG